ncbi:hypothetical protein GQ543_08540 [candidate division WOR-3 bacterium]|nr:hypothetical protein [candidate division WOR-3 bacterium]
MKYFFRFTFIVLFFMLFFVNCTRDGWYDDGSKYLCSDCKDTYASELAPCIHCGINYTPYVYCYDCAKELNYCQLCGRER